MHVKPNIVAEEFDSAHSESAEAASGKSREDVLRIYHAAAPSQAALNFVKIARCLGISAELIDLGLLKCSADALATQLTSWEGAAVWDVRSFGELADFAGWEAIASRMTVASAKLLILATGEDDFQSEVVKILSQGAVTRVRSAGHPGSVRFPAGSQRWSAELSGHDYERFGRDAIALELSGGFDVEPVMLWGNGSPAFVSIHSGRSQAFVWSTRSVFDVERILEREIEFEQALDEYVPAIIFLRSAFGERCWHSPNIGADIVIDDPLLTKRYGFIDFADLLGLAKELGFHVTVAFIPWNHWRTRKRDLPVFLDHLESFGICAHGCDHTKNEFRTSDYSHLLCRSHLAADWLDRHRERIGIGWERLMVCPREEYSIDALRAFSDCGKFLGLVNTGCIPRDMEVERVRGSDLLLPAQDAFFGFPIFKRHYWSGMSAFAMAAFLGKPAILVEHHGFFNDQHRVLKDFVRQLNATCPTVCWSGLTELARRTVQRRRVETDTFEVRFFTNEIVLENPDSESRTFRCRRRLPTSAFIESVTVDATQVSFWRAGEFLCFESKLAGNAVVAVRVQRRGIRDRGQVRSDWGYKIGVATRRIFSEIRDNWLARNILLLKWANRLLEILRIRGVK